jgi:hypothetical protein
MERKSIAHVTSHNEERIYCCSSFILGWRENVMLQSHAMMETSTFSLLLSSWDGEGIYCSSNYGEESIFHFYSHSYQDVDSIY